MKHQDIPHDSLNVIHNWRAAHAYPMFVLRQTLSNRAKKIHEKAIIAQRLKRLASIHAKLRTFPNMDLSQIQDIAGCRAVMPDRGSMALLFRVYLQRRMKHELVRIDDYVFEPKASGYRSVHLVYKYGGDKEEFAGLRAEVQIRTRLQHVWATAVEAVELSIHQPLKAGGGSESWLRFFKLMASYIAHKEEFPIGSDVPEDLYGVCTEIARLDQQQDLSDTLLGIQALSQNLSIPSWRGGWHHVLLHWHDTIKLRPFRKREYPQALLALREAELQPGAAVLVSVDSLKELKRAYPNYFADIGVFVRLFNEARNRGQRK